MNLLALDLGSRTGWAAWGVLSGDDETPLNSGMLTSGVQEFRLERGESAGMRYLRFQRWLEDMCDMVKPGLIAYENAYLMPTAQASEIFFGFITRIQATCALKGIEHMAVNAMTLKKWTTGGAKVLGHRASKQDMIDAVCKRWKSVTDPDEADAIALLYHVREKLPEGQR